MTEYTIAAVKDACIVLDTFLHKEGPQTLTEIVAETSMSKNKVFRILSTLEEAKLVNRTPAGSYNLHVKFLEFGMQVTKQVDVVASSGWVLDWLAEQTGESVYLRIIEGTEAMCVAARESSQAIRLFARVGERVPVYTGATALVLLAYLPEDERRSLLDQIELEPCAPNTIADRSTLEKVLEEVQAHGYAITHEDLFAGASAIGAPVRNFQGRVVAAVAVGGLTSRFTGERVGPMIAAVVSAGEKISRALGYSGA